MNYRSLGCGKEVIAVGNEGCQKDYEQRLKTCGDCDKSIDCLYAKNYLDKKMIQERLIDRKRGN